MVTSLLSRLRGRLQHAGPHTGQIRLGANIDLTTEFLLEALLELQLHIEEERTRHPAPALGLARDVARRLENFAAGVRPVGRLQSSTPPQVVPSRAWRCTQAALILQGPEAEFGTVLEALRDVLEEYDDRLHEADVRAVEFHNAVAREASHREALFDELSYAFGEPFSGEDADEVWERLLQRLRVPVPCPVPGCVRSTQRLRRPPDVRGCFPPDLCEEHTRTRFEAFRARLREVMPEELEPTHVARVPLPELAHLAPSPEALRDPPAPTRFARITKDSP
jgi:hypothetical protein